MSPRDGRGFGWVLSLRQFNELRDLLERGKVVLRSHVRARTYPNKLNVTSATIPGTDPSAGELLFVAHAFETIATPGANDNCSGVATTLEIARTLARIVKKRVVPAPRRTLRFLWVPEISGSRAFMYKYPELQDRLLAAMNFDMTGPDLEATDTYLRMKMTPDSRPSYLNDLIANLLQFVDQTDIRTPTGNNAPFNYRLVPYIANSDHTVFLDAGVPAMQFNHWADNFYHSSEDRAEYADPTELKRVAFMGAAAFLHLANAGAEDAQALAWESAANGEKWIIEVARQRARLFGDPAAPGAAAALHERHRAAQGKITPAYNRARGSVESVIRLSGEAAVASTVKQLTGGRRGGAHPSAGKGGPGRDHAQAVRVRERTTDRSYFGAAASTRLFVPAMMTSTSSDGDMRFSSPAWRSLRKCARTMFTGCQADIADSCCLRSARLCVRRADSGCFPGPARG